MTEPQELTALQPRPPAEVAEMAVAVQANLAQLKVACSKREGLAGRADEIRVPSPGAVIRFRETLIAREAIVAYDDLALVLRTHEVWGQFCLLCWFFHVPDPQGPPDFKDLHPGQQVHCPTAVLAKTQEIEKCVWRLRFEQRRRGDADFKNDPQFEESYRAAQEIPVMVLGESVQVCSDEHLLLGGCEFAGMLAAVRWVGDARWQWGQAGIMDLPGPARSR